MSHHLIINVFDTDLVWKAQIDSANSMIHRTSWHEISPSEMTISKTAQGVEELQIGRILVVNNQLDKALIIEDLIASLDNNYISFNLLPLKGMLNYRISHPVDSGSFLSKTQAEVMLSLAGNNLVTQTRDSDRKFWNSDGTKNMFQIAAMKTFGEIIDLSVDWETGQLGDSIISVAKMHTGDNKPIGWNVSITEGFTAFEMDVFEPRAKHINQTGLPPVIFSEEFGNIKNASYEYSIKDWRNVAYVNWNNGTDDLNTVVGFPERGRPIAFERKEMLLDSSKKTSSEVTNEGRSELNKRPQVESFTAEIINNDRTMSTYKEDWNLGDVVTIQSKEILKDKFISIDAQITEIEEVYDSGEYSINATFGEGKLTLVELIKNAIAQKK